MNEIKVDVGNAQLTKQRVCIRSVNVGKMDRSYVLEAILDRSFNVQAIGSRILCRKENFLSGKTALSNRLPSFFLISISLGGVCGRIVSVTVG